MRLVLFFDLPVGTNKQRREYIKFRKFLLKNGFFMMQQSVYTKIAINSTSASLMANKIRTNKPTSGLIQLLSVTEKQFSKMEFILGDNKSEFIDDDRRIVIL